MNTLTSAAVGTAAVIISVTAAVTVDAAAAFPAVVTVNQLQNNSKELFSKCWLTQFSSSGDDFPHIKSEIRSVATAQSTTVVPFPQRAFILRSSGADRQRFSCTNRR